MTGWQQNAGSRGGEPQIVARTFRNRQIDDNYFDAGVLPDLCGFTGKERDAESGLDYFGARYLASAQGRFTSPDWSAKPQPVPYADLSDPQTLNLYGYVRNNPLSRADADGHCSTVWGCVVDASAAVRIGVQAGLGAVSGTVVGVFGALATGVATYDGRGDLSGGGSRFGIGADGGFSKIAMQEDAQSKPSASTSANPADNTNPYTGPVSKPVTVVDDKGDAIPVKAGEQIQGSPDGRFTQAKDANGKPTGVRIDGPHAPTTHPDPRAQQPHAHVPGTTNPDGTPWLPINQ